MFKKVLIFLTLLAFVYCAGNATGTNVADESRAKKKKNTLRIWGIILLVIISKLAVVKMGSALFFWGIFQKFCYLIGLFINYLMAKKEAKAPSPEPAAPALSDYNTLGYSYGLPENTYSSPDTAPPPAGNADSTSYGAPYNSWPYNRRSLQEH